MIPVVKRMTFKTYSGPVIHEGAEIPNPGPGHIDRAYWLTTKVETGGFFGRVMAYDGTCMTAGPDQHIAVYPSELANEDWNASDDLGSLWGLLKCLIDVAWKQQDIVTGSLTEAISNLVGEMKASGVQISEVDGRPRYIKDSVVVIAKKSVNVRAGDLVHGAVLRDLFTPVGGKVPSKGRGWDTAKRWALLWHYVTAHPDGFAAQLKFGRDHLFKRTRDRWIVAPSGNKVPLVDLIYSRGFDKLSNDVDLALCVYHANSVNGPAPALTALKESLVVHPTPAYPRKFAADLIRRLGTSSYGRWDDDVLNGRYQRTRRIAMGSGLWPQELFVGTGAIMPSLFDD